MDTPADLQCLPAQASAKVRKPGTFTTANAKEMSARGAEALRAMHLRRKLGQVETPICPEEKYRLLNINRVQMQLERHWKELRAEQDVTKREPILKAIDRLAGLQKAFAASDPPDDHRGRKASSRSAAPQAE